MNRNYADGIANNVDFFTGYEIEHTPAWGMLTLFVTGVQPYTQIDNAIKDRNIEHIFFGANHSYNPVGADEHDSWEEMISHYLAQGLICSLDIPFNQIEEFNESGLCEYNNFIPQLRIPIPYIKLWNYNTMLKIDDTDFNATNPGVWSHSLHTLMNRDNFTDWREYRNDIIISPNS